MKRITLLLMVGAMLIGSTAVAQPGGRMQSRESRYEHRAQKEMRTGMKGMSAKERRQHPHHKGETPKSVMVLSCESTLVGETVNLNFMINYDGLMLNPNEEMVITPCIGKGENMIYLPPVVLLGERSYKAAERGQDIYGNISGLTPYQTVVMSREYVRQMRRDTRNNGMTWSPDSPNNVMYSASFPYQGWMDGAEIELMNVFSNLRGVIMSYPTTIGKLYNPMPPQVMFIVPEVEVVKARSETMTSRVVFLVNKSTIDPKIFNNASELERMYSFTDRLINDKNVKITGVNMTGYASPEGPYDYNAKLSLSRVNTIKELIQNKYPGIPKSLYTINNVPEDWDSVRRWVAASDIRYREQVLNIIDNYDPDKRDAKIRALDNGTTYNMLLHDVYPGLRRTVYTIDFTVLPFTVEEGKKVMVTNPKYLSLNELYQIALTYPVDSPEYQEVFNVAIKYFPDDPVANNNMAAIALRNNDIATARIYLQRVGEYAGAANNMGVLKALEGDYAAAEQYFRQAMQNGSQEAAFNLSNLSSLRQQK